MIPPTYQIIIGYSEATQQYEARVLELPHCKGSGWNYAAALAAAEFALAQHRKKTADQLPFAKVKSGRKTATELLRAAHGKLKIAEFTEMFGNGCSAKHFTLALGGCGARETRAAIALAVGIPPSKLWPDRAYSTRMRDDELYVEMQQAHTDAKSSRTPIESEQLTTEALA
jgi:hypothetical protein